MIVSHIKERLAELDIIFSSCNSLYIVMHDYPDPDALASAMVLSYLALNRSGLRCRITHGGVITRAENRAMVQQLKIKLTHSDNIRWRKNSCIAMVDTQPAFGNHSLPQGHTPVIVIDHHTWKKTTTDKSAFIDIRTGYGATATMLMEYLVAANIEIPVEIVTAVTYAILSETQDLGRDTSVADIDAYLTVYPKANKQKLAKIFHPKLPKSYFKVLQTALQKAQVFRHLARVHLGVVETPEFVPQIADLLLQHERIGWSIATGRFERHLYISLRCSHPKADAGSMLIQIIGKLGSAGGHPMIAGGRIACSSNDDSEWSRLQELILKRFLRKLGFNKKIEWKSMLIKDDVQNE